MNNETKEMTEKNVEQVEIRESENKPFTLIKRNKEVKIAVGNTIVSQEVFTSFAKAETYIKSKPYELIINTTCYLMSLSNEK